MSTPTELFIAAELPKRPYTNTFPFAAGKTLITTGVGLEVVAGDAPGEYLDNTFRIKDNDNTTKKIAFQASGIATGETRTITMPDADVNLSKTPTGIAADYISGGLSMPLVDGTYVNLNTFGGTHLDGPNSPATVLSPNGHYLFSTDTAFYYAGTRLLTLPTAPADKTYVRLSNVSGISSFATGAGVEVTPGDLDKINGSASTLDITTYLVNYRGAVITFTYTASSANWNMSVLGDLIRPSSVAIYDADKTNSTTLTPVADLTANRVITLPDADVNLGKVSQAASTSTDGYLTSTDWNTFNGKQAALVSGTNIKTVNGSSLLGSGDLITATIPEVKSASFTAVTGKAYTLGSPGSTLNIQFPIGTTNGEEIIIHVNRSAQTQTVYTVPPAGQHVVYVGAGSYQLVSGFCDHILRFEFVLSTQLWELKGIVPAGSITDVMAFRSSINFLSSLKFNLPTADGAYQWYTPAKNINFGTMSSVATTDFNDLSGTRTRIVGGSHNTVSGTDNVVIGGVYKTVSGTDNIVIGGGTSNLSGSGAVAINSSLVITNNQVVVINARSPNAGSPERNSILLGTSTQTDLFKNHGTAAALRLNALYALSSTIPVSGTLYATVDGSQTLSVSNLVLGVNDTASCVAHEVEFIVCAGVANGFGGVLPTGYFIAKRRIVAYRAAPSGTFFISAVQTIGTDITLGTLDGTITPNLSVDTTIGSATINRLLCTIARTGGVAGQEVIAMSVRVASHHST